MEKKWLGIAGLLGVLVVMLGAFGAHGLKSQLTPEQLTTYQTGVQYHFYHTLGILGVAILMLHQKVKGLNTVAWLFLIGIVCFSGSVYLLACRDLLGIASWTWLGPITPIGGILFIIGWGILAWKGFTYKSE